MTITDPNIKAGNSIYIVTPSGLTLFGTATADGTVTVTFTNDPVFMVTAMKSSAAKAPASVALGFRLKSSALSVSEQRALKSLATKLVAGASITVTGYAKNDAGLANQRAHDVAAYLDARVKIHVTIKTVTRTNVNKVTVVTTKN